MEDREAGLPGIPGRVEHMHGRRYYKQMVVF